MPVVLKFHDVASNANLSITFTTPGLRWCLGYNSADSLGFSYNVMHTDEATPSCIQQIEFNDALLAIRTASAAAPLNSFTLTLYLQVAPGVAAVQGYCTLNNEGYVSASFGGERPAHWRNGRISAVLHGDRDAIMRSVLFAIKNLQPNNTIVLELGGRPDHAEFSWSLGASSPDAGGMLLCSSDGPLPVSFISYTRNHIILETASPLPSGTADLSLRAYACCEPSGPERRIDYLYLRAVGSPNVAVYARVGNGQPQLVSASQTVFAL
jgi:hypothetical protein